MHELPTTSINGLNEEGKSLGVIEPKIIKCFCMEREISGVQTSLFGYVVKGKKDYRYTPYVEYRCLPDCTAKKPHKHQILEWGTRVFWDKNPDKDPDKIFENLGLNNPAYEKRFLVGNQFKYRKDYMVISVLRFKS